MGQTREGGTSSGSQDAAHDRRVRYDREGAEEVVPFPHPRRGTARRPTEVGEARVDYGLVFAERLRARTVVLSRR